MDPLSSAALFVVITSAILYALYWVIRRASQPASKTQEDVRKPIPNRDYGSTEIKLLPGSRPPSDRGSHRMSARTRKAGRSVRGRMSRILAKSVTKMERISAELAVARSNLDSLLCGHGVTPG